MTGERRDAGGLEETEDALRHLADDAALALLHGRDVEGEALDLDAVRCKLVLRAMVKLRGLEQCLGRDATGIEAGAAEGRAAVAVLPFVDAGDRKLVLRRANGRRIAGGPAADDDDVETVSHGESSSHL